MARLTVAGHIWTADSPDADGRTDDLEEYPMAILIEFDSREELMKAMDTGRVEFKRWDEQ